MKILVSGSQTFTVQQLAGQGHVANSQAIDVDHKATPVVVHSLASDSIRSDGSWGRVAVNRFPLFTNLATEPHRNGGMSAVYRVWSPGACRRSRLGRRPGAAFEDPGCKAFFRVRQQRISYLPEHLSKLVTSTRLEEACLVLAHRVRSLDWRQSSMPLSWW